MQRPLSGQGLTACRLQQRQHYHFTMSAKRHGKIGHQSGSGPHTRIALAINR